MIGIENWDDDSSCFLSFPCFHSHKLSFEKLKVGESHSNKYMTTKIKFYLSRHYYFHTVFVLSLFTFVLIASCQWWNREMVGKSNFTLSKMSFFTRFKVTRSKVFDLLTYHGSQWRSFQSFSILCQGVKWMIEGFHLKFCSCEIQFSDHEL